MTNAHLPSNVGVPPEVEPALRRLGLIAPGEAARFQVLSGGVSSDIWLVETPTRRFCVKRALPKLKVAADWRAPVARNAHEAAWLRLPAELVPGSAPRLLGEDADAGLFAMEWLAAETHPLWKAKLLRGEADVADARAVGLRLAQLHSRTAAMPDLARRFDTGNIFHPIRIEPYLLATAERHPDRADALRALAAATFATKRCLVHGDVSPKNILLGPTGPVFLDAECAWWGDPAFDIAFCLNHLLLKCIARPEARAAFLAAFDALAAAWAAGIDWEPAGDVERRAARLLPGLLLGRVDGKSPVEYLNDDGRAHIRKVARALLAEPPTRLAEVRAAWAEELDCR